MLGIITRISRDRIDQVSIETQLQQGIKLANKLGLDYKQYEEKQVSGSADIEDRQKLIELILDIEKGLITCIYCYDQSRMERSIETRIHFYKTLKKYNIDVYYETGKVGNDALSNLMGNLLSSFNQFTNELTSEKIKLALDFNTRNGKVHALAPYGYYKNQNKQYAIDNEQAEIIKEIFSLSLSGVGTNKIAEILNQRGVLTKYNLIGKGTLTTTNKRHKLKKVVTKNKADIKWTGNSVRGILYNKFYAGIRLFNGVEYEVPKIFNLEYWQKVNDNLKSNRNNSGKSVQHIYLLKGLLTCGRCGRNYYGRTRLNKKDNYYTCSSKRFKDLNCGNRSLNIDVLEEIIWSKFIGDGKLSILVENYFKSINSSNIVDDISNEIKVIEKKLKELDVEKDRIITSIRKRIITDLEAASAMNSIREERKTLEIKLYNLNEQLNSYKDENNSLDSILKELNVNVKNTSFNDKKEILNKYIDDIKIYYDGVENYYLEIFFNILSMESIVYVLKNNYKYAYPVIDIDSKDEQQIMLIILDEKLSKDFKNKLPIDLSLMVNSKQKFEELKKD